MIKRLGWVNALGIVLLAGSFLWSVVVISSRTARDVSGNVITLRMCHWQLEAGMRDAFDAVAREYTKLHPHIRIEQIAVPGRVYGSYTRTRLAGGNVPDLIENGAQADELLTRHYLPLTNYVELPNPYNAGTPLEGVPWRDTFIDGLGNAPGLETLQEYYAIPNSHVTVRVYYNKPLFEKITGKTQPPATFDEFMEMCRLTQEYAAKHDRMLLPVAGSQFNANILLDALFRGQTQKLAMQIDDLRELRPPSNSALLLLNNRVTLNEPAVRSGLELMRQVGLNMQPGFLQLDREGAIFYFAQGRALTIATGSWDYGSIVGQSPFEVGVFPITFPTPDHPVYGRHTLGPIAESGQGLGVNFFVSRDSEHPEEAIDFLRFLTSVKGHNIFVQVSKWLPAVHGVKPATETTAFAPVDYGYTDGFRIAPIMWGSGEVYRVQANALHRLLTPDGSVEQFLSALKPDLPKAVRADAVKLGKTQNESLRRSDTTLTAYRRLNQSDADAVKKLSAGWETQNLQEANTLWLEQQLKTSK